LPPLLALAGAAMTISNTAANSLLQATASTHLLGRTVGLYMLAMRGGISLGALITGSAVSLCGVQQVLLVNGVLAVILQVVVARMWFRARMPAECYAVKSPK
jgi:MFS family permease